MSDSTAIDSTASDADTASDQGQSATDDATILTEIKGLADELGISPGQLKGRLEASRKWEQRAKANNPAELEELRQKAKRFDEFEESQKSEQQKLADKLAAAEKRATELESAKLRAEVAADKGVPAALLSGSTLEDLQASADALLAFRGEKPKPDFGGGDRGTDVTAKGTQLTDADMKRMSPEEIVKAHQEGRFDDILSRKSD